MASNHAQEVNAGTRFAFGENWIRFLRDLDDERIKRAERSLRDMLKVESLHGKRFLDIGSGSGLFSLAARRLGATVHSFDYDPQSVACTRELKRRYANDDSNWTIEEASILDAQFVGGLGTFDIVYSWGVLHHTGAMWVALDNATTFVVDGGQLFIAIYNDQGGQSRRWLRIKRLYNRLPKSLRPLFTALVMAPREMLFFAVQVMRGTPGSYFHNIRNYSETSTRGMNYWRDLDDWVGGLPFECAKPETVFRFCRDRNFELCELRTWGGGLACNEFVFRRREMPVDSAPKQ